MTSSEDEDDAGMEALRRELEPLYEKARQSDYGLLWLGGDRYAVIVRTHCSSTRAHRRHLALPNFEFVQGYEQVDWPMAIKHLLKLRAEEDAR